MNVPNVVFLLQGKINLNIQMKTTSDLIFSELRPVIVEPWDIRDEEDGLPEKSLIHTPVYAK